MQAWFISDIHIKNLNERNSQKLLRFLHLLATGEIQGTHLFLVGDIFDLWISNGSVFIKKFKPIIDAIVLVKNAGIHIVYFEGNHDVHVKHFWQQQLGIPTFVEEQYFQLGTWKVRVEHGDLINPDDLTYLKYRELIRKPFMESLAPYIGSALSGVGNLASQFSRKKSSVKRATNEESLRDMIRRYADQVYSKEHFDLIITGHMHILDDYTFIKNSRKVRSINLGSWFDGAKALKLTESTAEFISL